MRSNINNFCPAVFFGTMKTEMLLFGRMTAATVSLKSVENNPLYPLINGKDIRFLLLPSQNKGEFVGSCIPEKANTFRPKEASIQSGDKIVRLAPDTFVKFGVVSRVANGDSLASRPTCADHNRFPVWQSSGANTIGDVVNSINKSINSDSRNVRERAGLSINAH